MRVVPEPKWCIPFLAALGRTGNVSVAALKMMAERRRRGGVEMGKLVLHPGSKWTGMGPRAPLPGHDDDDGWDAVEVY